MLQSIILLVNGEGRVSPTAACLQLGFAKTFVARCFVPYFSGCLLSGRVAVLSGDVVRSVYGDEECGGFVLAASNTASSGLEEI